MFAVAAGLRLTLLSVRGPSLSPDSGQYLLLAENLRRHQAFSLSTAEPYIPTIRRAPLYPAFLAATAGLGIGGPWGIAALQLVIDALSAVGVLLLARRTCPRGPAVVAGLAYAAHPGAVWASTTILAETLFTALCVAGVLALVCAAESGSRRASMVGGALLGAAALCRPVALPLPVVLGAALLSVLGWRRTLAHVGRLVVGAAIVVGPWAVRCSVQSGGLVVVQGASAVQFYIPTRVDLDQSQETVLWHAFQRDPFGRRLSEARTPHEMLLADRQGMRLAWQNIRTHPLAYLASRVTAVPHLCITSFDAFSGVNKSFGTAARQRDLASLVIKLSLLIAFSLAPLLLAMLSLQPRLLRSSSALALSSSVWIFTLVVHIPLWIEPRFWNPAVPFIVVSAASALPSLGRVRSRNPAAGPEARRTAAVSTPGMRE